MQLGIIVRFATDTEKFFLLRASSFGRSSTVIEFIWFSMSVALAEVMDHLMILVLSEHIFPRIFFNFEQPSDFYVIKLVFKFLNTSVKKDML